MAETNPYLEENDALLARIADITAQVDHAKSLCAQTGEYSDASWFARANHALRHAKREHQKIQAKIGAWNRDQRRQRAATFERSFLSVCRRRLDGELFQSLWDEAHQEFNSPDSGNAT